jgi:glycosyltransferase involved in cell wall biosynthesis
VGTSADSSKQTLLVLSPWKSRWSLGNGAGVSDDHHFIDKFAQSGFEIHFLVPRGGDRRGASAAGVHIHTYANFFDATEGLPTAIKRLLWPFLFNIIVTVRGLFVAHRVKPDFILGHSHYSSLPCYMIRELCRVPSGVKLFGVMDLVHTEWSASKYYFKNFEQIAALKIPQDAWIILDDGTKGGDAARRHGVSERKIHFLPNGIDLEWMNQKYDGDALRKDLGIQHGARVVLFLARLVASKRPELLIRAIPEVMQRTNEPVCFLFVGDGEEKVKCESLVRSLGLEDVAIFAGAIPHERVPEYMATSDLFVSTSRLTNAAIPTCEAMVCGLPAVALDVGNTSEIIKDGENGRVVADGDTAALAEAIAALLNDNNARLSMSRSAQAFAAEHFTGWDRRIQMEVEIVRDVIEDAPVTATST